MKGITFIRKLYNMSLQDVADKLNVSKQTINKWEKELRPISEKRLEELENLFDIPREYFEKDLDEENKIKIQELKIYNEKMMLDSVEKQDIIAIDKRNLEYSMYDELVKCSELLDKFGGHPMAAGLSLMEENIDTFRKKLNDNCTLSDDEMTEKVRIDAVVPIDCMTMDITKQLSLLEPCGKANTKPVFAARNVRVTGAKVLGQNRNAIRLNLVSDSGATATGITFGDTDLFLERLEEKFGIIEKDLLLQGKAQHTILNMLFYPKVNVWNGTESLQIVINDIL